MKSIKRVLGIVLLLLLLAGIFCIYVNAAPVETNVEGLVLDDPSQYNTQTEYVDASIEKIITYLDMEGQPDWLKVLRIHDFVCMFVEYDWDNYLAGNSFSQNLYSTLTTGKTMCDGYTRLTQRLLWEVGIESKHISCEILNHAWNVVLLDGKWYNMDVTWDDPDRYDEIYYDNFLRCDENFGHLRGQVDESEFVGYYGITISDADFYCGSFGEDLYWVISEDKTLTFYGNGDTISNGCTAHDKVRHAVIPEGIVAIGDEYKQHWVGFADCDGMTDVTIPASLTYIGANSFSGCYWLTDVYYAGSEEQWNAIEILSGNEDLLNARIHFAVTSGSWDTPSGACGDDLTWTLTKDRVLQISGTGDMYDYAEKETPWYAYRSYIYDVVIGDGVTGIGQYAFDDCDRLVGFAMPDSVTTIGNYAFADCTAMRAFTIPDTVSSVGEGVFYGCNKLREVDLTGNIGCLSDRMFYGCQRLFRTTIPEGIASIGDYCFYECSSFSAAPLPESLTAIGQYAFANCTVMDEIVTSPNITKIAAGTFYGCNNISRLEIPDYITEIGQYAFGNCDWLETITFSGRPIFVSPYAFCNCNYLQEVVLTGVTGIGQGAFSGCYRLEEIAIPNSVTSLGDEAFANCAALEAIEIPGSVKDMGQYIFKECPNLNSVTFHEGVTAIGEYMFSYCIDLEKVTFPNSLTSIGNYAFDSCRNLESITLPKKLNALGDGAFYGCALKNITIPSSVKTMGTGIFVSCDDLETAVFENGVGSVGEHTFGRCYSLSAITLPNSITQIGEGVFSSCSKLKTILIPCGVTSVGYRAFQGCSLTDVYYGGTQSMWQKIIIGEQNTSLTDATMHFAQVLAGREGVCNNTPSVWWFLTTAGDLTIYGNGAIESCGWNAYSDEITSITILPGVTSVGGQVFRGLKNVVSIQIPDTVTSIDSFGNCTGLKSIVIPDSVTELGTYTFLNCTNLTDVILPSGLTAVPEGAFAYCSALKSVTLPAGITGIGNDAFSGCSSLEMIQLPAGLTRLGEYAFYNCSSLANIVIPAGVAAVEDATFYGCAALTEIDLPEGVRTIGAWAFYNCENLSSVVLPATLKSVGENSFSTWLLSDVYFTGSQAAWEEISIASGNANLVYANMHYNWVRHAEHSYGEWEQICAPSCTAPGEEYRACIYCDYMETRTLHATGHTEGDVTVENESAASCTQSGGYDEVIYCVICSEELRRDFVTIPAKGHSYAPATCTAPATCGICGATAGTALGHDYAEATCTKQAACRACGTTSGAALGHDYNAASCINPATCKACGVTSGSKISHRYDSGKVTKKATCKETGVKTYTCSLCNGKKTESIAKIKTHTYTNACDTGCNICKATRTVKHSYKTTTTKATMKKNGKVVKACSVCGKVSSTTTVYKIKSVKLSTTKYTYNGKKKTPTVTVKDSKGNKLKKDTDYTVSYDSGRKKVGEYEVTVKFKGKYSGTEDLEFKIAPKGTTVSKLTAKSKALSVKLKKQTSQTTGYQIEYSTSSKFSSSKKATVSSNKTTTKTIKGLKKGKKYYVRVRTYKVVDGKKIYSDWSKAKSMKTK